MIEKSRTYLDKELRTCFRNKKHAIERCNPASETQSAEINAINEKIRVLEYLLQCLDVVELMKEEREKDNE